MAKLVPPQAVRILMTKGCSGVLDGPQPEFDPAEQVALVRWLARLLTTRTPEAGDALVETLVTIADVSAKRHAIPEPLACHRGCSSCCHQLVSVPAPELFAIARQLRRSKAAAEHRERLAARPDRSDRGSVSAPPCVFLKDEACSIHAVRPLVCRLIVSLSKPACVQRFSTGVGGVPYPRPYEAIRGWLITALWTAHSVAGIMPTTYDYESGLAAVMADPGLEARWYAGEAVLTDISDGPLPPAAAADIARLRAMARV